jgi:pilus assembly protein Flp/PilA
MRSLRSNVGGIQEMPKVDLAPRRLQEGSTMKALARRTAQLLSSEDGPTATEYAILLALIIVVAMASIRAFGFGLRDTVQFISAALFS